MEANRRLRLLLVEDEALIAMDLECMVEDLGHEVIGPASTIEQAIALLYGLAVLPDAAIIDANLGGRSARPVLETLAASNIPVIVASGYNPEELAKLGLGGASLSKPYNAHSISEALRKL